MPRSVPWSTQPPTQCEPGAFPAEELTEAWGSQRTSILCLAHEWEKRLRFTYIIYDVMACTETILLLLFQILTTAGTFHLYVCMYVCIGFKTFFYAVRQLDSISSYLPTGIRLGFFRSRPSLFLPFSFSSVFLVLSFVSASTSMLF
jgi:hypothetical protein